MPRRGVRRGDPLGPVYARSRSGERTARRVALGLLVAFAVFLACRPTPAPETAPPERATTADRPERIGPPARGTGDLDDEERVVVPPIETEDLLPPGERRRAAERAERGPLVLRVGLATDLARATLPCCDRRVVLRVGGEEWPLDRPITVEPAAGVAGTVVYRLQVAALKDEAQARALAARLALRTEEPAEAVFDADTDLYRVRVGRFENRAEAETGIGRLTGLGIDQAWVVAEGGALESPALVARRGDEAVRVEGRWLEVRAPADVGVPWGTSRYRGTLAFFLNARGRLNAINEIELEDYLRGVVPKEMGPELYDRIEAIKAQTVAARTYTLRHLGEFTDEGYDICSTPRCQVYGGMLVEHPVSDQAIRETDGQVVLFGGEPAQTFYSATCGGHTENVEVVFPAKTGAYLRGVPCLEAGATTLRGDLDLAGPFPGVLARHLLPPTAGEPARSLSARLEHLALLAGLSVPADRLRSLERREVLRYVASVFDVVLDRRLLGTGTERLLREPPDDWRRRDFRLATHLRVGDYFEAPERPLDAAEVDDLLVELALYLGVLGEERGYFLEVHDGRLRIRRGGEHIERSLGGGFATFRNRGGRLVASPLDLMAGDRLRLYWHGEHLLALVQPVDAPPVDFGKRAPKQQWTVWKSAEDLRRSVQKRYPGFSFVDFEILERGVSGRVGRMVLVGADGQRIVVEGLAIRWTLDVWDTLFWAEKVEGTHGVAGWRFRGRGWGHGVGMGQAGAFGMAVRGATYREILEHYYTGVRLGRLEPAPPRPRTPA